MDFKSLETRDLGAHRLRAVEVGLTSRCNMRCEYCCAYDLTERRSLTANECIEILKGLPDLERVKLSGGEVTLHFEECLRLVEWCAGHRIYTQINTNGTLLDRGRIDALADAGLNVLHFSLNHIDADSHSRFYRVKPSSFATVVTAIREAAANPKLITVGETILFNETKNRLSAVHRFLFDLGVRRHEIQMEIPGIHAGYASTLDDEEISNSIADLLDHRMHGLEIYFSCLSAYFGAGHSFWGWFSRHGRGNGVTIASCIEGKAQLHVHSNGDVLICELGCPQVIGNVFETSLAEIFASRPPQLQAFLEMRERGLPHTCFRNCDSPGERKGAAVKARSAPHLSPRTHQASQNDKGLVSR